MIQINLLRNKIKDFLQHSPCKEGPTFQILDSVDKGRYQQLLIEYLGSEYDQIKAYLLVPKGQGPFPAVLIHHQHNGERHLGKSEVCGLVGDSNQAFGPMLASEGVVVLCPDSICFEDRRRNRNGIIKDTDNDFLQHYNEMCYRILSGTSLMKKVLDDASIAISLLNQHPNVDANKLGVFGHSYGGNTAIFQGALDERIQFACSSGALCSFENKIKQGTGMEMALVIPGFINHFEMVDLIRCFQFRKLFIVSATEDKYSKDADDIIESIESKEYIIHKRYTGGHALTKERFEDIITWILKIAHFGGRDEI